MQEVREELRLRRKALDKQIEWNRGMLEESQAEAEKYRGEIARLEVLASQYGEVIERVEHP